MRSEGKADILIQFLNRSVTQFANHLEIAVPTKAVSIAPKALPIRTSITGVSKLPSRTDTDGVTDGGLPVGGVIVDHRHVEGAGAGIGPIYVDVLVPAIPHGIQVIVVDIFGVQVIEVL